MTKNIEPRHYDVIVSPAITEKSTVASEQNQVIFNVAKKASKPEITFDDPRRVHLAPGVRIRDAGSDRQRKQGV